MPSLLPMMLAAAEATPPRSSTGVMNRFLAVETDQWSALYDDLKAQGTELAYLDEGYRQAAAIRRVTDTPWFTVHKVLATVSAVASAFHGVRRNNGSIGWGLWWFVMGGLFPVITPAIAVAQGFAKEK